MATDNTLRIFEINGNTGFFARVNAELGNGSRIKCIFDDTGKITNLPGSATWSGIKGLLDYESRKMDLVQGFSIQVNHAKDEGILVTQRGGHQNFYRALPGSPISGDLVGHQMAPCSIDRHYRSPEHQKAFGLGPTAVWTKPMGKELGPNRVDLWSVNLRGALTLFCIYLVTLDDGKTFRLIGQERWTGTVYKRKAGSPAYTLKTPAPERKGKGSDIHTMFKLNDHVRRMFNDYVFVPGDDAENFEGRAEILMDNDFRKMIEKANLGEWHGTEDFWVAREPGVQLGPNQAVVKFLTYGVGQGSYGILTDKDGKSYQFDHHAVVGELADDQGALFLPSGTIVNADLSGALTKVAGGYNYSPPKLTKVVPINMPVPIDPKQFGKAAEVVQTAA